MIFLARKTEDKRIIEKVILFKTFKEININYDVNFNMTLQ